MGCAGQVQLPEGYLKQVFKLVSRWYIKNTICFTCYGYAILCVCRYVRQAGGLCIVDEIQTGFGRAGDYFWIFETQGEPI